MELLLARGACIETFGASASGVSFLLLLARGACIETPCFEATSQS